MLRCIAHANISDIEKKSVFFDGSNRLSSDAKDLPCTINCTVCTSNVSEVSIQVVKEPIPFVYY